MAIPTFTREALDMGIDAYETKRTNRTFIHAVTKHTDAVFQFLNNPWDDPERDWIFYREIRAFEGLRTGDQLPNGLKAFPSVDREQRVSPETGRPVMVTINDPILDLVAPGRFDDGGRVKAAPVMAVNAIVVSGRVVKNADYDPDPGTHVILKFSRRMGSILEDKFRERLDENPNFDATAFNWGIKIVGEGPQSSLEVRKAGEAMPATGVEAMDLPVLFGQIRSDVEEAIAALDPRGHVATEPEVFMDRSNDDAEMDAIEAGIAAFQDAGVDVTEVAPNSYAGVSDASLRRRLTDAGVKVPRGASREVMLSLAEGHNV